MSRLYFVVSLLMRRTSALFLAVLCSGAVGMAPDAGSSALPETQTAVLDEAALDALSYDFPDVPRDAVYANHDVLVIVPHEDDEVCLLGGVFEAYVRAGSTVRVVFVTNGDSRGGDSGQVRIREAIAALSIVGIPEENVIFLGYGDQWRPKRSHIYHADSDEQMTSHGGFQATYGTPSHPAYHNGTPYTRSNLKADLRSVIEEYRPDTIFCIDCDGHRDHRAVSLFFEEIMGEMLRDDASYTPTVFKGFGYRSAWFASPDFYKDNIRSTKNASDFSYLWENPSYLWAERIRFPVEKQALGRLMYSTSTYQMLAAHASQNAAARADRILNGDRVFWLRETSSLLYRAALSASSGDASLLNDFKRIDIEDVGVSNVTFSGHVWSPDDENKAVAVTLDTPAPLSELWLYDNPNPFSNVLDAEIAFSDGSVITTGPLAPGGDATVVRFPTKSNISGFTLRLLKAEGGDAGLTELEAYAEAPSHGIRFIKLKNAADDFVYDYWVDPSGSERFSLYTYPAEPAGDLSASYRLVVSGGGEGCSAVFDGDGILVTCVPGSSFTLKIESLTDPSLFDAVRVSNPSSSRRLLVRRLQQREAAVLS